MTPARRLAELWNGNEKVRFLAVGVWNTAFGYGTFALSWFLLHRRLHYLAIWCLSHLIAVLHAFILHRWVTFRVQGQLFLDFLRFNLSYLAVLGMGLGGMPLLIERCRLHPLLANAVLITLTTLGSFLLHKRVSFRRTTG